MQALPSSRKEVIELLDILLRWFVLRFCESNTTCLLKVNHYAGYSVPYFLFLWAITYSISVYLLCCFYL